MDPKKRTFETTAQDAAGAMTFLVGQLEYLDPIINDPLHAETYAKYLPIKTGAGWVQSTSFINSKPLGQAPKAAAPRANVIRRISADLAKTNTAVYLYQAAIDYTIAELNYAAKAGYNIDNIYALMQRLDYEKVCDRMAFCGDTDLAIPGLIQNRTEVSSITDYTGAYYYTAATGSTGGVTWAGKMATATGPEEVLQDLADLVSKFWQRTGYSAFPNTIAVPPAQMALLLKKYTSLGNVSILKYFQENNLAQAAGVDLKVVPLKWLTRQSVDGVYFGGGHTQTNDRMVAYINNPAYTRFHLPVPLTREDVTKVDLKISIPLQGLIGGVEIMHNETIVYTEGI
jgi:hypothetical protein